MISLKKLLTEDVNYILKKSPNAIIAKAADLMAGVFRIKFKATRDEETPPNFEQDIMYVLTSPKNTQYGPASKFANGDWYYVIGDDRKQGSERRLVTDVLIYPKRKLVNVDKGKQEWQDIDDYFKTPPKSSGKVGSSDVIKVSDFVSVINTSASDKFIDNFTGASLIKQINDILNNTIADVPSGDEKIVVVKKDNGGGSSSDTKEKTAESKFKPGDTFVQARIGSILLFKLKDTFDPKTDIKQHTTANDVVVSEINGLWSNARYVDKTPEWLQFEKEMFRDLTEFEFIDETTPLDTKYKGYTKFRRITKEQYDRLVKQINDKQPITTDLDTFFSGKEQDANQLTGDVVLTYTSQYDDPKNPGVKLEQKIRKQQLIGNTNLTDINWVAEAFQQLIMQKVVPTFKDVPAVKTWASLNKPIDGKWGDKSKAVIRALNKGYKLGDTDEILPQLIEKLTAPLKTESVFSLKSILLEQDLSGFDYEAANTVTVNQPIKKEVPKSTTPAVKSTTPAVKTAPKPTVTPKKEPAKTTTTTPNKSLKVTTDKPYRRGIENVAKELKAKLRWDAKLKVWYIDREIGISRDWMPDAKAFLHLRDDGTLMLKVYNLMANVYGSILVGISEVKDFVIVRGVGSGWTDGGKKMKVEILLAGKEPSLKQMAMEPIELRSPNKKTFNITGSSFLACLQAAVKRSKGDLATVDGFWFPTIDKYGN
jgi:hypothetical protein